MFFNLQSTVTCVALSSDDSTIYSGSKDNSVIRCASRDDDVENQICLEFVGLYMNMTQQVGCRDRREDGHKGKVEPQVARHLSVPRGRGAQCRHQLRHEIPGVWRAR